MTLQVTINDIILLQDNLVNEGEYNVKTINFEFSDEYTGLIKKCRFITDEEIYEEDILDNQCEIPIQVTSESGYIRIGVYAYNEIDGTLELRYSPTPLKYLVRSGSYTEDEVIVPERLVVIEQNLDSDSEAHVASVHAVKIAVDDLQNQINNLDVSGFEAGENVTFTENPITNKTIINATDTVYDDTEIKGDISTLESGKVDKVAGKGLSTEDYTTNEKEKLASLENYDDTQIVQDISDLSSSKADKSTTYTKNEVDSLIPDVSSFITKSVDDLVNYYKKNETYTQNEVNSLISAISTINILVVQELPIHDISTTTIYLVPKSTSETNNIYDEYIYVSNAWEKIGDTQIDLSNYVTISELNTALANYTTTNDLTALLNAKQNVINSSNKLNADLVDDSNSTNKFFSGNYNDLSNKPTIPSALSDLSEDTTHRVVTDTEKTTWNSKQSQRTIITSSTATYTISSLVGNITYKLGNLEGLTINAVTTFDDETNMYFASGSTATTISIPDTLVNIGDVPTLTASGGVNTGTCEANKNYIISICNNIAIWKNY